MGVPRRWANSHHIRHLLFFVQCTDSTYIARFQGIALFEATENQILFPKGIVRGCQETSMGTNATNQLLHDLQLSNGTALGENVLGVQVLVLPPPPTASPTTMAPTAIRAVEANLWTDMPSTVAPTDLPTLDPSVTPPPVSSCLLPELWGGLHVLCFLLWYCAW